MKQPTDFSAALRYAKSGRVIRRPSGPDIEIVWDFEENRSKMVATYRGEFLENYMPSYEDLFADDWSWE